MEPPKDPNFWTTFFSKYWPHILTFLGLTPFVALKKGRKFLATLILGEEREAKLDYETKRALDDIGRAASAAAIDASKAVSEVREISKENREYMENMRTAIFTSLGEVHEKANAANLTAAELKGRIEALEKRTA